MLARNEDDGTEKVKASEVTKAISKTKFNKLLKSQRAAQGDMDEIRGNMGAEMKAAVEKDNLDKKMFGWVKQLDRMSPEKLAYHLPNLMLYIEHADLEKRAAEAPPLDMSEGDSDGE